MNLTIVMPILGRPLFTLRALWYLNLVRCPCRIIVADGSEDSNMARILADRSLFPHLELLHFRRLDVSPNAFLHKCLESVAMVDTPYVQMFENDDFIFPRSLQRAVDYLDANPGYVAAGGAVAGFYLGRPADDDPFAWIVGKPETWSIIYGLLRCEAPAPVDRIFGQFDAYFPSYYCVHRTGALREAYRFVADTVFNELLLHELFLSLATLAVGKIRTFGDAIGYMREMNLGGGSLRPWPELILSPRFDLDYRRIVEQFPALVRRLSNGTDDTTDADWAQGLRRKLAEFVQRVCLGTVYHRSVPGPVQSVVEELSGLGATAGDVSAVVAEIDLVQKTMIDPRFVEFVREVAPSYLRSP